MIGIYKITNKANGKVYIGQSTNIQKRWAAHKSDAFNPKSDGYDYPLYRAMRKYGVHNFLFEVLEECLSEQLDEKEIAFIKQYNAHGEGGYNQDDGGGNAIHGKLNFDDIAEIHKMLSGRKITMRQIAQMYNVHYNTIKTINNGTAWVVDGVEYPIRKKPVSLSEVRARINDAKTYTPSKERIYICPICGNTMVTQKAKMCKTCDEKRQRKVENRPSPLDLARLVKENGFTSVGKQFGVDGNTVKKWCKNYNMPHKIYELVAWYNEQVGITEHITPIVRNLESISNPVKQIDPCSNEVVATFTSRRAAARCLIEQGRAASITTITTSIGRVISGRLKTAYGYKWECA